MATGHRLWTSDATIGTPAGLEVFTTAGTVAVPDGSHVGPSGGVPLHGLHAATGRTRWTYRPLSADRIAGVASSGLLICYGMVPPPQTPPLQGDQTVYFAVDMDTGKKAWAWTAHLTSLYLPPTGQLMFGVDDHQTSRAFQTSTGGQAWMGGNRYQSTGVPQFQLQQGTLVTGTGNYISARDAGGSPMWDASTGAKSGWAVSATAVCYVDDGLYGLDLRTGAKLWTIPADPSRPLKLLGATEDLFVFGTSGGAQAGLYGWDARTGRQRWHAPGRRLRTRHRRGRVLPSLTSPGERRPHRPAPRGAASPGAEIWVSMAPGRSTRRVFPGRAHVAV